MNAVCSNTFKIVFARHGLRYGSYKRRKDFIMDYDLELSYPYLSPSLQAWRLESDCRCHNGFHSCNQPVCMSQKYICCRKCKHKIDTNHLQNQKVIFIFTNVHQKFKTRLETCIGSTTCICFP
jgi:hypothetical protein